MSITRRHFSAGLAAAASLPLVARGAPRAGSQPEVDVLVIGAGLSGLQAALLLEEQGATVQVIEAQRRIGGRVFTLFDRPGYPEVGGNGFASGYGRVLDRVRSLGLPLLDYAPRRALQPQMELFVRGQPLTREAWAKSPLNPLPEAARARMPWEFGGGFVAANNPLKAAQDWTADSSASLDVSMRDWLSSRGVDDRTIELCWSTNPYFGSSAHDVSALQCLFNDAWIKTISIGSTAVLSVLGGNQQLPQGMARQLKNEVHLGREAVHIDDDGRSVSVTCADGSRYRARRVICSVPFSVLRHIRVTPGFTGRQVEAVSTLGYMVNTLVFFVPRRKYWESDGMSPTMWTDGIAGNVMGQRFGKDPAEITAIVANPRGIAGNWLDRLPPADAIARVKAEIERLRPAAKGALTDGFIHSWARDPHAAGDWAVFGPGQVHRFARSMAAPHGRIHFCGEHTAQANRGMEGAMESAERAALEVLEAT